MSSAERQQAFQQRKAERIQRMVATLRGIDKVLAESPNQKPWLIAMRKSIAEALE